jgi:hypothetical protein
MEDIVNTRNYRTLMLAGHAIFALTISPLVSYGWQTGASPTASCLAVGQMSGWDIVEHTLSLKSDSGHYSDMRYDDATVFTDGNVPLASLDVNVDDRICVQAFRDQPGGVASRVLIIRRAQIDSRDKADLMEWERDSIFGTVKALDADNGHIALRTPGGSELMIDVASSTAFWILAAEAIDSVDVVPGNWKTLTVGDALYVRGDRASGTGTIRARLLVAKGFRSFVGTLESMEPLTDSLGLRDFRSGRIRPIHFDFNQIYIVGSASRSAERRLYGATVGDLKEGDSVLVLARQDGQTGKIEGFVLLTGFSRDAIVRPAPGQSLDWIFDAIGLGTQPGTRPISEKR